MKYLIIPALAGTLFLGGCAELMGNTGAPVVQAENRASIVVRTQVLSGGVRTAAVPRLTADSIDHLVLKIFELAGTTETPVLDEEGKEVTADLTRNQLSNLITFSKLKPQTTYRIRAYAYKAPGTAPENLISTNDAGSYVDVEILVDDRPTVTTLKVKLIDVDFDGKGTFQGVTVTPGGYLPTGPVTITIEDAVVDEPLVEGTPAHQGMIDMYLPDFKNGMTWTYKTVYTIGGVPVLPETTVVQEISELTAGGFTLTTTTTEAGGEPVVETEAKTAAEWFPPATALRELHLYENVTVGAGTYSGSPKFGLATNTTLDRHYMWLANAVGMVQYQRKVMTEQGELTVLQTLESFESP